MVEVLGPTLADLHQWVECSLHLVLTPTVMGSLLAISLLLMVHLDHRVTMEGLHQIYKVCLEMAYHLVSHKAP